MLVTKEIEVNLCGKNIKYYSNLGYKMPLHKTKDGLRVKNGSKLIINIKDLPLKSHLEVMVKCDYCGNEFPVRYDAYNKQKYNDIDKDCCIDCRHIKNEELNLLRYGVKNQYQRKEIQTKIKEINLQKYGTKHPMQNKEIKYKSMKNMSDNNGVETSRQQKYLHNLLGGKLNYIDTSTKGFLLDIAFPKDKFLIEYNGSGHELQVKFGNMTQKEFDNKEIKRYQILKRNGWKQIVITSKNDYLPSDEVIIEEFNKALEWFKSNNKGH